MTDAPSPTIGLFEEFFNASYKRELEKLAEVYPEKRSLSIDYKKLDEFNIELADELIHKPYFTISSARDAIQRLNLVPAVGFEDGGVQFHPYVRFLNLPPENRIHIRNINSAHINTFLSSVGVVTKITDVKPRLIRAAFECRHCGRVTTTQQDDIGEQILEPAVCSCERKSFRLLVDQCSFIDTQRAEIQEPLEMLRGGEQAKTMTIWIQDDLTNKIVPGNKIDITGVLRLQKPKHAGSIYDKFLDINNWQRVDQEFEELDLNEEDKRQIIELSKDPKVYEKIIASIAPSIYGLAEIKQAIALQLFGGTPGKVAPDGMKIRPDIHQLLIGDPGTAKTQLLRYVKNLAPKGLYVSGKSSSGAGLTATAEKDEFAEGGWTLKAGALVLAAGGMAMIDEFDKMEDEDRSSMHEAMESQQISVAKAGIVTTFKANAAILAAANPKYGRFDPFVSPAEQFDIPVTILSRFDAIFPIRDVVDEVRDRDMAEHILQMHQVASAKAAKVATIANLEEKRKKILPEIDPDLMRKYIAYARREVFPVLSEEAVKKIQMFYTDLRKLGATQRAIPITARQLEAIVRLAEASAKIRFSNMVEEEDADRAVNIFKYYLKEIGLDRETGQLDIDIIATGSSRSKSDKIMKLFFIIKKLNKDYDEVQHEMILDEAKTQGIKPEEVEGLIATLKRNGDIYSPRYGVYKPAEEK